MLKKKGSNHMFKSTHSFHPTPLLKKKNATRTVNHLIDSAFQHKILASYIYVAPEVAVDISATKNQLKNENFNGVLW